MSQTEFTIPLEKPVFETYFLKPDQAAESRSVLFGKKIVLYASNPGPSKATMFLARRLVKEGVEVVFKLKEPALGEVLHFFSSSIEKTADVFQPDFCFTCGHIDSQNFLNEMRTLCSANPNLKIITMDDNFDGSLPLIIRLLEANLPLKLAFLMNKDTKDELSSRFKGVEFILANNPAFENYYLKNNNPQIRQDFRKELNLAEDQKLLVFIGFPEYDYPDGYADFVFNSFAEGLKKITEEVVLIYWPHGRGVDRLPSQFQSLPPNIQVIFKNRAWWRSKDININTQIVGADVAFMTNSTTIVRAFMAYGKNQLPMAVPFDISLLDDFPNLPINKVLRNKNLALYLPGARQIAEQLHLIVANPEDYQPPELASKMAALEWDENPVDKFVDALKNLV